MKRFFLIFLAAALLTIVVSLHGYRLWAESPTSENKKVKITAKSVTGPMNNIKAGQRTDSSEATATNCSIILDLSEDKTSITKVTFSVGEVKWKIKTPGYDTTGTSSGENIYLNGPFPIRNNSFKTGDVRGTPSSANGRFISSKEARGSAHLYSQELVGGQLINLDLGEWQWKATAK